jgi:AcrR family transcriptional regulator
MSPTAGRTTGKAAGAKKSKTGKAQTLTAPAVTSLRARQKEVARQMLIEAARAAFEAKGYVDVTVDEIAQGAGASRGTFYLYFQSKSEILSAILAELRLAVNAAGLFDDLTAMQNPTVETLQAWFEKYVDFYLQHHQLWYAIRQAQVVEPDFSLIVAANWPVERAASQNGIRSDQLTAIDLYAEIWKSRGPGKRGADADARLTATMMYTFVDQFMYIWLVEGQKLDRRRTTRALAEALHATLPR